MARTIIHDPNVILLDDPDSGLAAHSLDELVQTLGQTLQSKTIVLTSHNVDWALPLVTDVLQLSPRQEALKTSIREYHSLNELRKS